MKKSSVASTALAFNTITIASPSTVYADVDMTSAANFGDQQLSGFGRLTFKLEAFS